MDNTIYTYCTDIKHTQSTKHTVKDIRSAKPFSFLLPHLQHCTGKDNVKKSPGTIINRGVSIYKQNYVLCNHYYHLMFRKQKLSELDRKHKIINIL